MVAHDLENCERIFVKWHALLVVIISLISLAAGIWTWTWAEMATVNKRQDVVIESVKSGIEDVQFIRSQSNEILENQKQILKYFERRPK